MDARKTGRTAKRAGALLSMTLALVELAACGGTGRGADAGADVGVDAPPDAGTDAAPDPCEGFVAPTRPDRSACEDPDPDDPRAFVPCERGSGWAGAWTLDGDGLPAYDFAVEQRCDPAAQSWSPRRAPSRSPLRDPIHLVGNGRGVVAMAHASGAVELYSQERGHAFVNRVDTWRDPRDPEYPPQIGGGFNYFVVGDEVRSNRFEDLPVGEALERQTRRFGVGYVETVTRWDDFVVTRTTFALDDADARALVAQVRIENLTPRRLSMDLVEIWDANLHPIEVELATSDLGVPNVTEAIDRRRRARSADFDQTVVYDDFQRTIEVRTRAKPGLGAPPTTPSQVDWHPHDLYLFPLDGSPVNATWLDDRELFTGTDRTPPAAAAAEGDARGRTLFLDGAGQHALLAMRSGILVPASGKSTYRFVFGYVPEGGRSAGSLAADLRTTPREPRAAARAAWEQRLVLAAFPGLAHAGAVQRELAWASYNALAHTTHDEYHDTLLLGQGGSYKYIHGLDGAVGDLCLFADSVALVDPLVARETLEYALGTQHGPSSETPFRYPYATTGVGTFSDVGIYDQRSDAYWMVPSAVGRYVAVTGDRAFLDRRVPFWPREDAPEDASVRAHIERGLDYAESELGLGARGLVAMGTGDYADGIHFLSDEPSTNTGTSSVYNAALIAHGLPLLRDLVGGDLATRLGALVDGQTAALEEEAWNGARYERAFVDSGNPLAPDTLFLEPQVLPILAGLTPPDRTAALLALVEEHMETPYGAMSTVPLGSEPVGGLDEPQIGGIWPIANAWLTEAYARHDPAAGWDSFVRNTLMMHAEVFPGLWYGVWTGPDSYHGPDHERAGEADAHLATALTDYPALNAHVHTSPLRALMGLVGVEGTPDGLRIAPRVPTETFTVSWPALTVAYRPDRVEGALGERLETPAPTRTLTVRLPVALRGATLEVRVDDLPVTHAVGGDEVSFEVPGRARFAITAAP